MGQIIVKVEIEKLVKYGKLGNLYVGISSSEIIDYLGEPYDVDNSTTPVAWSYEDFYFQINSDQVMASVEVYISDSANIYGLDSLVNIQIDEFYRYIEGIGVEPEKIKRAQYSDGEYKVLTFPPITHKDESIYLKITFTDDILHTISLISGKLAGQVMN